MPVHIGEMTSEVAVADGELPLSEAQVRKLVALVCAEIEKKEYDKRQMQRDTTLNARSMPSLGGG